MGKLLDRITALEHASKAAASPISPERRAKAERELAAFIADAREGVRRYDALDAAGRIRHWKKQIRDAEAWLGKYSETPPPLAESPYCAMSPEVRESFHRQDWALTKKGHQDNLAGRFVFELVSAQLDRLQELRYSPERMTPWLAMRERWKSLPWQWRADFVTLPNDALALLK